MLQFQKLSQRAMLAYNTNQRREHNTSGKSRSPPGAPAVRAGALGKVDVRHQQDRAQTTEPDVGARSMPQLARRDSGHQNGRVGFFMTRKDRDSMIQNVR